MMKAIVSFVMLIVSVVFASAQVNISKVDKASPNDEVFMDMAVSTAQKALASGHKANGAVLVLNGAWKATGLPGPTNSPETQALAKIGKQSVGAVIFTVNQPTPAAINAMNNAGVKAVYFVNTAEAATATGIYTAADYAGEVDPEADIAVVQMIYAPASALLK